jgi:hypothetical protein
MNYTSRRIYDLKPCVCEIEVRWDARQAKLHRDKVERFKEGWSRPYAVPVI